MRVSALPWRSSFTLCVVGMLVACGTSSPPIFWTGEGDAATGDAASSSGADGNTATSVQNEPGSSSGEGDDSTTEPSVVFLLHPDGGGVSFECDLFAQDCPPGHKCAAWADDGGSSWNATQCVPIAPDPDQPGEPCTVVGSSTSGIDTCDFGAVCWYVDSETLEGTCVSLCQGDESNPTCPEPDLLCGGNRNFPLCLPMCCPVEQDCPEGQACYAVSDRFWCAPDASGDLGAFGDPCEYINVCDPGLLCLDASAVPDCASGIGCCTEFCTVGATSCSELAPGMECVPWYEEGAAPPGYELTGVCALPQ